MNHLGWDAVVVDEGAPWRPATASAGPRPTRSLRARVVLLLRNPHSGEGADLRSLCRIRRARPWDPLVMFRRTRERTRHRRPTGACTYSASDRAAGERGPQSPSTGIQGRLEACGAALAAMRALAMTVLLKRSLSGMEPLRRSLAARIERLGRPLPATSALPAPVARERQKPTRRRRQCLPHPASTMVETESPCRRWPTLPPFAAYDAKAARAGTNARARPQLGHRVHRVRDTLESLRSAVPAPTPCLHGGMDRLERADAVATGRRRRVLLATDAVSGNSTSSWGCRLVVEPRTALEPMRLERRIGRVDRIGQQRTVHVVNLLASGTAETDILAHLVRRLERAGRAIGAVADVLGPGRRAPVMAAWLGLDTSIRAVPDFSAARGPASASSPPGPHLRAGGIGTTAQLTRLRQR